MDICLRLTLCNNYHSQENNYYDKGPMTNISEKKFVDILNPSLKKLLQS